MASRILLVADDPKKGAVLATRLRTGGCHVKVCPRDREALDCAMSGDFDAVLLDVVVPGKSRFATFAALESNDARTPVLVSIRWEEAPARSDAPFLGTRVRITDWSQASALIAKLVGIGE